MAKSIKPTGTRKPPLPGEDHAPVEAWISSSMPRLQPVLRHLDAQIRQSLPGVGYAVKWKKAYYGLPGLGWVIELAAYDVSANVVFFAGARFDPPPPLGEGSRYVKLYSLEEAQAAEVAAWIEQAGRYPGWAW